MLKSSFCSSGIIYFMREPVSNTKYIILAQEAYNPHNFNSCLWSSFEGGPKASETELQCAVRECCEESLSLFHCRKSLGRLLSKSEFRFKLCVNCHTKDRVKRRVCYVVEIPFQEEIVIHTKFTMLRQTALQIKSEIERLKNSVSPAELQNYSRLLNKDYVSFNAETAQLEFNMDFLEKQKVISMSFDDLRINQQKKRFFRVSFRPFVHLLIQFEHLLDAEE